MLFETIISVSNMRHRVKTTIFSLVNTVIPLPPQNQPFADYGQRACGNTLANYLVKHAIW